MQMNRRKYSYKENIVNKHLKRMAAELDSFDGKHHILTADIEITAVEGISYSRFKDIKIGSIEKESDEDDEN